MHRLVTTALLLAASSPAWACANAMKDGEAASGGLMSMLGGGVAVVGLVGFVGVSGLIGIVGAALFFFSR